MDSQAQLSDIQTYLATFNPKEQGQIILQPDGSFIKGEDQAQMDDGSGLEPQVHFHNKSTGINFVGGAHHIPLQPSRTE